MLSSTKTVLCFILSFMFALLSAPLIFAVINKFNIKQTTLGYVSNHIEKNGTPTMGGLIFLFPLIIGAIFIKKIYYSGFLAIFITIAYGIIGFIDDFIKIKYKHNEGLKPYQKIIAQLALAIINAIYSYNNLFIGPYINVPFLKEQIDLKWLYIPFVIIIYLASTNGVNLTDGLDGLASKTSIAYLGTFLIILVIQMASDVSNFEKKNLFSLILYTTCLLGGLFAFLWFNAYPAKIFMGDTGSLSLGAAISCVALFSKNPLLILIIGIMYVITSLSVIIQVSVYKLTKKRVFKMAPLHHHFQYMGIKESKIVTYYTIITIFFGAIAIYSII